MSNGTGSDTSAQQQLQASMLSALRDIADSNENVLQENRITSEAIRDLAEEAADRSRQRRNNRSSSANDSKESKSRQSDFSKNLSKSILRYNKAAQSGQKFQEILYEKKMKTTFALFSGTAKAAQNVTSSLLNSLGGVGKIALGLLQASVGVLYDAVAGVAGSIASLFIGPGGWFAGILRGLGGIVQTAFTMAGTILKSIGNIAKGIFDIISEVGKLFVNMISSVKDAFVAVIDVTIQLAKTSVNVIKGILSAPYSMIEAALKLGNEIRREIKESIIQSLQDVKESFDLDSVIGQSFVKLNRTLASARGAFQSESSEYVKLFGFGIQGLVAASKEATENIMALGPYAEYFTGVMNKNLLFFTKIKRALNLTSEDMRFLAHDSFVTGKAITATYSDLSQTLDDVAKNHQIDLKRLSGSFFELRKDIQNFGHLTNQDLAQVTARMRQMGLEAKSASDLFNKFTTFEEAANSAALLSQVFGMNVDALRLIQAEGPDEIAQMFRESMLATGRTYQDLNRHEKALMSQYTGLGDEALRNLMSYQTMGMSVAEIRKQQEEQDPTQRMIRATRELTSAVRELQKAMTFDSPIQAFFSGLKDSVTLGGPLRGVLSALSGEMVGIRDAGVRLGRSPGFVRFLKSVEKILTRVMNIFTGPSFTTTLETFAEGLAQIFELIVNPELDSQAVERNIKDVFERVFENSSFINEMLKFGGNLVGYIIKGIAAAIPAAIDGLTSIFTAIFGGQTDEITGTFTSPFLEGLRGAFGAENNQQLSSEFGAMFNRIKESFVGFANVFKNKFSEMLGLEDNNRTWINIGIAIANNILSGLTSALSGNNDNVNKVFRTMGQIIQSAFNSFINSSFYTEFVVPQFAKLSQFLGKLIADAFKHFWEIIGSPTSLLELVNKMSNFVTGSSEESTVSGFPERRGPQDDPRFFLNMAADGLAAGLLDGMTTSYDEQRSLARELSTQLQRRDISSSAGNDLQNFLRAASIDVRNNRGRDDLQNMFGDDPEQLARFSRYATKSMISQFGFGGDFEEFLEGVKELQGRRIDLIEEISQRNLEGNTPVARIQSFIDQLSRQNSEENQLRISALQELKEAYEYAYGQVELNTLTSTTQDQGPQIDEVISQRIRDDQNRERERLETIDLIKQQNEIFAQFLSKETTVPLILNSTKVGEALIPSMLSGPTPLLQTSEGQLSVSTSQPVSPGTPSR